MTFDSILQGAFMAGWSSGQTMAALAGVILLAIIFVGGLIGVVRRGLSGRRARLPVAAAASQASGVADQPAVGEAPVAADLDPEEWITGNVIHLDRHKAFGFIRCDRVKAPVRFEIAAGRLSPPRIGEAVRFKGRHGARRRAVAVLIEPVAKARRAG